MEFIKLAGGFSKKSDPPAHRLERSETRIFHQGRDNPVKFDFIAKTQNLQLPGASKEFAKMGVEFTFKPLSSLRIMGYLVSFVLLVVYVGGVWRFLSGYRHTNFSRGIGTRISLALLWPGLLLVNPAYRKNFQKALKGR